MIINKLICVLAFWSFSTALQFVQVGERPVVDGELPIVEILDSTDQSVCAVSNTFHDFTANKEGIGGITTGMFLKHIKKIDLAVIETGMACDFIFDKGICCGGTFGFVGQRRLINEACGYLTNAGWTAINDMPEKLMFHASVALPDKKWWLISGGQNTAGERQKTMYYMDETLSWNTLSSQLPRARSEHCMVQYGSNEVAFIGGRDSANTRIAEIDIYNLETEMWSTGPELPADIEVTRGMGCQKIENANTIVLGCASITVNQTTGEIIKDGRKLYTLDLSNDQYTFQRTCWSHSFFEKLDDDTVIVSGSNTGVWTFDMENGLRRLNRTTTRHRQGDAFTLPDGTLNCD